MPHPTVVSPEHPPADVVCLGETMAVLSPPDDRPLADQSALRLSVGGAESNVACGLAALGHRAAWLSRVGDDAFGRRIRAELAARGVEVGGVAVDPAHPTGVYFRTRAPDATRPLYCRSGSAAASTWDRNWPARPSCGGRGSCTCRASPRRCPAVAPVSWRRSSYAARRGMTRYVGR
ncbi:PfkB family carbohydrate kinase [Streptomyces purpurascens]